MLEKQPHITGWLHTRYTDDVEKEGLSHVKNHKANVSHMNMSLIQTLKIGLMKHVFTIKGGDSHVTIDKKDK